MEKYLRLAALLQDSTATAAFYLYSYVYKHTNTYTQEALPAGEDKDGLRQRAADGITALRPALQPALGDLKDDGEAEILALVLAFEARLRAVPAADPARATSLKATIVMLLAVYRYFFYTQGVLADAKHTVVIRLFTTFMDDQCLDVLSYGRAYRPHSSSAIN